MEMEASSGSGKAIAVAAAPVVGSYVSPELEHRELVVQSGARGTRLVIDRLSGTAQDARLVAHLAADEPDLNAELVCRQYLGDANGRFCRPVRPEDLDSEPAEVTTPRLADTITDVRLSARAGEAYTLARVPGGCREILALRWLRERSGIHGTAREVVSLRSVIGALESYEPARTLTAAAIDRYEHDRTVSVAVLSAEMSRLAASPITLNRLLRETVRRALIDGLSMSLIAIRCGRIKRDPRGNVSGETSWLGRRLGLLPEAGGCRPTPWIHSDVLAVIARKGLGISPREVELG